MCIRDRDTCLLRASQWCGRWAASAARVGWWWPVPGADLRVRPAARRRMRMPHGRATCLDLGGTVYCYCVFDCGIAYWSSLVAYRPDVASVCPPATIRFSREPGSQEAASRLPGRGV
eukprot:7376180-Prymnesium_polylepis.1